MKWTGRRQSSNVDDRRSIPGGGKTIGGGIIAVIITAVVYFMNGDTQRAVDELKSIGGSSSTTTAAEQSINPEEDQMAQFISVSLADCEDFWNKVFKENGETYAEPTLVLFRESTVSGCGNASASTGPFYCPADQKIYMDLSFFDLLESKFGAKGGDFAISYVLAHEVGHHIQTLLGTSTRVHELEQQLPKEEGNKYSVALELQADFYAGIWAHYNQKYKGVLEDGDIEEALSAAQAVGDDMIQKRSQGYVVPESFTHGTSAQRMMWFKKGFETGDLKLGDTFKAMGLRL